jgi:hypothetical protein
MAQPMAPLLSFRNGFDRGTAHRLRSSRGKRAAVSPAISGPIGWGAISAPLPSVAFLNAGAGATGTAATATVSPVPPTGTPAGPLDGSRAAAVTARATVRPNAPQQYCRGCASKLPPTDIPSAVASALTPAAQPPLFTKPVRALYPARSVPCPVPCTVQPVNIDGSAYHMRACACACACDVCTCVCTVAFGCEQRPGSGCGCADRSDGGERAIAFAV